MSRGNLVSRTGGPATSGIRAGNSEKTQKKEKEKNQFGHFAVEILTLVQVNIRCCLESSLVPG